MDGASANPLARTQDVTRAHIDDDTYLCCPIIPDGQDSASLLQHRLDRLQQLSQSNLRLAILCLVYIGVNIACLIINCMGQEFVEKHERTFHLLEFWATFCFSIVQVYSLVHSPRSLGAVYSSPLVLKVVMFVNVVATFIPAVLVSVDLEAFEVISHEVEYTNELTMSFVDVVLLAVVTRHLGFGNNSTWFTLVATLIALAVAVVQLAIYNALRGYDDGPGEMVAHFFEFGFEIVSSVISFSFCMDNKHLCESKIKEVLFSRQRAHVAVGQPCSTAQLCVSTAGCTAGLSCASAARDRAESLPQPAGVELAAGSRRAL